MLVTCPECGARYDIDGSLIPPEGRRVQCSACDNVWQQAPGDDGGGGPSGPDAHRPDRLPPAAEPEDEAPRARPPLAEDVKAILRQEAEHEKRVRRQRGLVEIEPGKAAGAGAAADPASRPATGPLPDADAINATLRAASERAAEARGRPPRPGRGGFAAGLTVGLVLVGVAWAAYVTAPRMAEMAPGAAPWLEEYVARVDDLRLWLDTTAERAVAAVFEMLSADG